MKARPFITIGLGNTTPQKKEENTSRGRPCIYRINGVTPARHHPKGRPPSQWPSPHPPGPPLSPLSVDRLLNSSLIRPLDRIKFRKFSHHTARSTTRRCSNGAQSRPTPKTGAPVLARPQTFRPHSEVSHRRSPGVTPRVRSSRWPPQPRSAQSSDRWHESLLGKETGERQPTSVPCKLASDILTHCLSISEARESHGENT